MFSIKDAVKDGKLAHFSHFRLRDGQGELWYKTECGFEFPVPTSDVGDAKFQAQEKAMHLMRWMRKHVEVIKTAQTEQFSTAS